MQHFTTVHLEFIGLLDSIEARLTQAESLVKLTQYSTPNPVRATQVLEGVNGDIERIARTHDRLARKLEQRYQNTLARITVMQIQTPTIYNLRLD